MVLPAWIPSCFVEHDVHFVALYECGGFPPAVEFSYSIPRFDSIMHVRYVWKFMKVALPGGVYVSWSKHARVVVKWSLKFLSLQGYLHIFYNAREVINPESCTRKTLLLIICVFILRLLISRRDGCDMHLRIISNI